MNDTPIASRGPAVFAVTTAIFALSSVFVFARLLCRITIVRRVGWDDYCIAVAWLLALGLTITIDLGTHYGLGLHDSNISTDRIADLRKCEYALTILYNPALMATKTSILLFYLRLFRNIHDLLRFSSYAVLGIVNIAGTVLTLLNIFQCRPIAASFSDMTGKCIPVLTEFLCSAPVNIVTDLAILLLPLPVLTSMRLPSRQKFILVFTFGLGIFVTVVDVVRIYYLQEAISEAGSLSDNSRSKDPTAIGGTQDFSWNASFSFMWSAVEVNTGIICACIPTLKPLIIKILPAMLIDPDGTLHSYASNKNRNLSDTPSRTAAQQSRSSRLPTPSLTEPPSMHGLPPAVADIHGRNSLSPVPESASFDLAGSARNTTGAMSGTLSGTGSDRIQIQPLDTLASASAALPPVVDATSSLRRHSSALPRASPHAKTDNAVYFGFVNMTRPKSMLDASTSESLKYCTTVAVLFFLWGFSYGLINSLNSAIATVARMSLTKTLGLTSAYFGGGYLFGPLLVGGWVLRHDEHHRRRSSGPGTHPQDSRTFGSISSVLTHTRSHRGDDHVGGFKATFIVGLLIYGVGTIMFWPSAVLVSYAGFLISSFVVGFGLSVLETAANPFLALCGPPEYAEMRLLLAQGLQGASSVGSGLLADKVLFGHVGSGDPNTPVYLLDVQWTYLAITLFCWALAMFFYYMPLPEVCDADLEKVASRLPVDGTKRTLFGGLRLRSVCLVLAVLAQWLYVGSQECMSLHFHSLMTLWLPSSTSLETAVRGLVARVTVNASSVSYVENDDLTGLALSLSDYLQICRGAFALSRFAAGFLVYYSIKFPGRWWPSPRTILMTCIGLTTLFSLLAVVLKPAQNANLIILPVVLFFFAEGPIYPLIFAIGLRGQGANTKLAAMWMTAGTSGPLFWPFVMYGIMHRGGSVQTSFIVVVCLMGFSLIYPLYLLFWRDARQLTRMMPAGSGDPGGPGDPGDPGDRRSSKGPLGEPRQENSPPLSLPLQVSPGQTSPSSSTTLPPPDTNHSA